ncbi:hypothetical protein MYCTH_92165 [Thermothelomyces thermophilus ATCC 42464]|uniref:Uncharacterized protein n=1 Tax=Thermothelomyces thermophilus (strain ATCC 42464 / BCRC 31852 / DSM 1799) TaxID=573729 RepID=G2Q705_THET4|nr:uncharacterized protein MYCTH_92165 [Thermothelomyces thermophilus ATCC 42464]AEO54785.1 hypothetical protein MYCTH_92165 [Thermothelomyces thermophilus ATCC 42464]
MCYIEKNVYTLALRSCRPCELAKLKYWFCPECREHYRGYDTNSVDAILNYWAYKTLHGFSYSVSPQAVPGEVLAGLMPVTDGFARPSRSRDGGTGFGRLEKARSVTLDLAGRWSTVTASHETREPVVEHVVRVQPQAASPMSAYPHAHVLSSITEHGEEQEPATRVTASRKTGKPPYHHPETLARLCGEVPQRIMPQSGETQEPTTTTTDPGQSGIPPASPTPSQTGHEMGHSAKQIPLPFDGPPSRSLTAPAKQQEATGHNNGPTGVETTNQKPRGDGCGPVSSDIDGISIPEAPAPANYRVLRSTSFDVSAEPTRDSPTDEPVPFPQPDPNALDKELVGVILDGAPLKIVLVINEDEPSMTSHFSISDLDPDEAAELAGLRSVSPPP